jgi:hypothetical protein
MKDQIEYQIINAKGRVIHIFDDKDLAEKRLPNFGIGCSLVEVRKTFTVLATNRPAKAAAIVKLAAELGVPVVDIKMSA